MDAIGELLAYIFGIVFFGLPLIVWFLVGRVRRRVRLGRRSLRSGSAAPEASKPGSNDSEKRPVEQIRSAESFIHRIRGPEDAGPDAEPAFQSLAATSSRGLAGFQDLATRGLQSDGQEREALSDLRLGELDLQRPAMRLLSEISEGAQPGKRRGLTSLGRLQRALVMSEILGKPVGLRDLSDGPGLG